MSKIITPAKEVRSFSVTDLRVETRDDGKTPVIRGYAVVFNSFSQDLGGFKERVMPGCFTRCLAKKPDVRALVNHDANIVLGRSTAGTLRLAEDPKGLAIEIDPPDTAAARDLMVSMKRGDVNQMSFAFSTITDNWHNDDGAVVRDLIEADLYDVSVVTYPAYTDTAVAVRSMGEFTKQSQPTPGVMSINEMRQRQATLI